MTLFNWSHHKTIIWEDLLEQLYQVSSDFEVATSKVLFFLQWEYIKEHSICNSLEINSIKIGGIKSIKVGVESCRTSKSSVWITVTTFIMTLFCFCFTLFVILSSVSSAPIATSPIPDNGTTNAETTTPMTTDNVTSSVASNLPNAPYDCSVTNMSQRARAIASFQKGLSLIVDELNHRVLQVEWMRNMDSVAIT